MIPKSLSTAARFLLGLALILGLLSASVPPAPTFAQEGSETLPQPGIDYAPGEVLVKFSPDAVRAEAINSLEKLGVAPARSLSPELDVWTAEVGSELQAVERLLSIPGVEHAQPNYYYRATALPDDPYFDFQWAHERTNAQEAWDITTGSANVIIAILDTGIDESHPELSNKLVYPKDYVDFDNNPHDGNGHGTHVAGIAAGRGNNGVGIAGVSWGTRIMPVRVLDDNGSGYTTSVVQGIRWAYQHGAKVINLSLSGTFKDDFVQQAINEAYNAGTLVVAAMGNDFFEDNSAHYPAAMDNVLAVGATSRFDGRAYYSNTGSHIDVSAPGGAIIYDFYDGIFSTTPTYLTYSMAQDEIQTNYDYMQGTSMATPYVAGLAALIFSVDPGLSPAQVESIIKTSADDLGSPGFDNEFGYGRVNLQKALEKAMENIPELFSISNADGDNTYLVDWSDVSGATGYELQEDDNSAFSSPKLVYSGPFSQYQVNGQGGGLWYYRVRAVFGGWKGSWSVIKSTGVLPPAAPDLKPIVNPDKMDAYNIEWEPVAGVSGYVLQEADNPAFSNANERYRGTSLHYNVTGQRGGKTWYYRVAASNQAGVGPWSTIEITEVKPDVAPAPEWVNANISEDRNGQYELSWFEVPDATAYFLEQSQDSYFANPQKVYEGPAPRFSVLHQTVGTWYYRARAVTPEGMGPWGAFHTVIVFARNYLPVVRR